jgi:hypothetical protein
MVWKGKDKTVVAYFNLLTVFRHYCSNAARLRTPDMHWYIQIVETGVQDMFVSAVVVEKCN